tara:strand:+ start:658 stop:1188 length:531 start_codon:yes stop_codon:yes gene_type:complete
MHLKDNKMAKFRKKKKSDKRYYKGYLVYNNSKGRYINKKGKKQYLPKGVKTTKKKSTEKDSRERKISTRLSARSVYNKNGKKAIGKKFKVLQKDGSIKVKTLKLRKNGSPYFTTSKFGYELKFPLKNLKYLDHTDLNGYTPSYPFNTYMPPPGLSKLKFGNNMCMACNKFGNHFGS